MDTFDMAPEFFFFFFLLMYNQFLKGHDNP